MQHPPSSDNPASVLFVCAGNICRSPLAEGVFIHVAEQRDVADRLRVDSCGTGGWHAGSKPDRRSIAVARSHGVALRSRARQVRPHDDFLCNSPDFGYRWIIAMDRPNRRDLLAAGAPPEHVHLIRAFDPHAPDDAEVPDPYYGEDDGFARVYDMIHAAAGPLLDRVLSTPLSHPDEP